MAEFIGALDRVSTEAAAFLARELSLAGVELRMNDAAAYEKADLNGDAGETADLFANLFRGGGMAGGVAAVAVPFLLGGPCGIAAGSGSGQRQQFLTGLGSNKSRDVLFVRRPKLVRKQPAKDAEPSTTLSTLLSANSLRAYQHLLGQPLHRCCVPPQSSSSSSPT